MNSDSEVSKPGQYLTFQLGSEQFGVSIAVVREINRLGDITPVPRTPAHVEGVMNLRGKIIPVIQLRVSFGLKEKDSDRDTCVIVIDTPNGQIGVIVDAVREVVDLRENQIEPPPQMGESSKLRYIRALGKMEHQVLILVDIVAVLGDGPLNVPTDLKAG